MRQIIGVTFAVVVCAALAIALPAAAVPHGDCNGDGDTKINELQTCANIFLETRPLDVCPECDADGENGVTMSEVQGVANCYLNVDSPDCRMLTPIETPASTATPTPIDTATATPEPTDTPMPSNTPTGVPTNTPTAIPTNTLTGVPTNTPTAILTNTPTAIPTNTPTAILTNTPTAIPTNTPTAIPTSTPTAIPTNTPTAISTNTPTAVPSNTATAPSTNTPTAAPTNTQAATFTATATQGMAVCGNGVIEPGETCDDGNTMDGDLCPSDCSIVVCPTDMTMTGVAVTFSSPVDLLAIRVFITYPDELVQIPGTQDDAAVQAAVTNRPSGLTTPFDFDYALRYTVSRSSKIPSTQIAVVHFSNCAVARAITNGDFACTVQLASNLQFQEQSGVTCAATLQ